MFIRPLFRLVPDDTRIQFMRGRFMGLIVSAVLSTASIVLFFYPGLHLGIDFSGGVVMEVRTPAPADFTKIRAALAAQGIPEPGVQRFGDDADVLIRLAPQPSEAATQMMVNKVRAALEQAQPGQQGAAHRRGRRLGLGRTVPQRHAGAGHQPADDPGLYLVPLRVAVRRRRGGDADSRRHQGDRLPGASRGSSSTW